MHDVREWFERRSYDYTQFADPIALADRKRELGLSVSALLSCLRATPEVRTLIDGIYALNERAPLTDQIAVIAASSSHGMDAACPDVEVYTGDELMPEYGLVVGKGDVMWRALSIARGDLVVYADVEAPAFEPHFVRGVLRLLLSLPRLRFANAAFECPSRDAKAEAEVDVALAELMVCPLLNLHYPKQSGFSQPLARSVRRSARVVLFHTLFHRQPTGDDYDDRLVAQGGTRCDGPSQFRQPPGQQAILDQP